MSRTAHVSRGTAATAALAAVLAVAVAGLGVELIPSGLPAWDVARREWLYSWGQQAMFLVVAVALASAAVTGAVSRRSAGPPAAALAASVAAVAWASLAPALWAVESWVRAAGLVLTSLLPAALLHLAMALRSDVGPARARRAWRPTAASYVLVGAPALLYALSRNPFADVDCVVRCESVDVLLDAAWTATYSAAALSVVGGLVALAAAATALAGAKAAAGPYAHAATLVLAGSAVLEAAWMWWPGSRPVVGPLPWEAPLLLEARAVALGLLALGLTGIVLLRLRRRASLRRLAREIAEVTPPARMSEVIARRLGDASTRLEFFVDADGVWVDEEGRLSRPEEDRRARQTALVRRGADVVARLSTGPRARDLEEALGPAALLALEAERTRAEHLLRLRDLRDNRRRAVQRSDLARRRAERDLHDGAQHLLLAASFALQEAIQASRAADDHDRAEHLAAVAAEVSEVAREVREVAHGIYPVLLGDAGLVPALEGLARESLVPVSVDATAVPRMDLSVELTAYLAAATAVRSGLPGPVGIAVSHEGDILRVTIHGAAPGGTDVRPLEDRTEALGGTMDVMDGTWHLELPCA